MRMPVSLIFKQGSFPSIPLTQLVALEPYDAREIRRNLHSLVDSSGRSSTSFATFLGYVVVVATLDTEITCGRGLCPGLHKVGLGTTNCTCGMSAEQGRCYIHISRGPQRLISLPFVHPVMWTSAFK